MYKGGACCCGAGRKGHQPVCPVLDWIAITTMPLTTEQIVALNAALQPVFITVKYLDPIDGITTRTFYGSTVESTTQITMDGETYWTGTTFNLIEQ